MDSWSFFKRGRPAWLTTLPGHESPGVIAFLVAIGRALLLTAATLLALFPVFRAIHDGGFDFGLKEGFLFAVIFAFFEDHARWNYVVNAKRPFAAATRFAVMISLLEILLIGLSPSAGVGWVLFVALRATASGFHFLLSYAAAGFAGRRQAMMFAVFLLGVVTHAAFNLFGTSARIVGLPGG